MPTLTTPRGTKLRTTTKRLYVLVREADGYGGEGMNGAWVVQRSDDLSTLRRAVKRDDIEAYSYHEIEDHRWETWYYIFHVPSGEIVPLDGPIFRKPRRTTSTAWSAWR